MQGARRPCHLAEPLSVSLVAGSMPHRLRHPRRGALNPEFRRPAPLNPPPPPCAGPHNRIRKRLDRVFARLADWRPAAMRIVGTAPIAGATYVKRGGKGGPLTLPVLPSDHFGLHVVLEPV